MFLFAFSPFLTGFRQNSLFLGHDELTRILPFFQSVKFCSLLVVLSSKQDQKKRREESRKNSVLFFDTLHTKEKRKKKFILTTKEEALSEAL